MPHTCHLRVKQTSNYQKFNYLFNQYKVMKIKPLFLALLCQKHKKSLRIMKISFFMLLVCFQLVAMNTKAQDAMLNLKKSNLSIKELISEIESQTEYLVVYSSQEINVEELTSVSSTNSKVKDVLKEAFAKTNIYFKFDNDYIILQTRTLNPSISTEGINQRERDNILSGTVIDSKGEPIIGASIVQQGINNGTITDIDGKFTLDVPEGAKVIVSYIGYASQEFTVGKNSVLSITLIENTEVLDEVVVVGYGVQKKSSLTGSVVAVKGNDIQKSPAMNTVNSLTGRLPGLIINSRSDEPGRENIQIFIRGRSTTGNASPLYIIDGVERGGLGQLNPKDIENISVLKDASAAIYGARAANGVIMVTTKRGSVGKPTVSLSFNQGYSQPTREPKLGDSYTFAKVWNETLEFDGLPAQFTQEELNKYRDGTDPNYPNTNWHKEILRNLTPQHRADISISGGTERVKYYVALGEAMQEGHYKYGNMEARQFNLRSNIDIKVNDWIQVGLDLAGRQNNKNYPLFSTGEIYSHIFLYFPTYQLYWPGTKFLAPGRDEDNLINLVGGADGYDKQRIQTFESKLSANIQIPWVKGLSLATSVSFDTDNNFTKRFQTPTYVYRKDPTTGELVEGRAGRGVDKPVLSDRIDRGEMMYFNGQINYGRSFGINNVGATFGYEQRQNKGNHVQAGRSDYISSALAEVGLGSPDPMKWTTDGSASNSASQSIFGRVNYDYAGKYLVEATFRYDGSTFFPKDNRFGFFPGISAGWRISEENFMKQFTFLNNLKIRGSYGEMGNDKVVTDYQYLKMYESKSDYNYVIGGKDVNGIRPSNIPNPNITWETARTWNIGFEATLWNGLLGVEFDYFKTKRSDMLSKRNAVIPDYTGLQLPEENFGKMQNQGFEVVVSHSNQTNKVKYSLSANMAFARNKVLFTDEAPAAEPYQMATGRPYGSGLYYKYLGVFQTQEQLDSYPAMAGYGLGDFMYEDVNKDGVIDSKDRIRIDSNAMPEIVYGFNATISYKGFDLSVLFQGQANAARSMSGFNNVELNYGWGNFYQFVAEDRWSLDNPTGTKPRANNILFRNNEANTLWYTKLGFLRLKNLELGYTLPKSISEKVGASNIRILASGYNLFLLFDDMKKWGLDPEYGADWGGGYSLQRTYNFGINVTF